MTKDRVLVARKANHLNWLHILLGMLPAVIVGGLFHDYIKEHLFSATTVLWALVAGGILMIIAEERFEKPVPPFRRLFP
jgi:undecaprenyl-diphosphatase